MRQQHQGHPIRLHFDFLEHFKDRNTSWVELVYLLCVDIGKNQNKQVWEYVDMNQHQPIINHIKHKKNDIEVNGFQDPFMMKYNYINPQKKQSFSLLNHV